MAGEGPDRANLRIGELARRTGVAPDTLRAWERRYGLLDPVRTPGGFRLYGERDERVVRRMLIEIGAGLSAAQAAEVARAAELEPEDAAPAAVTGPASDQTWGDAVTAMTVALDRFDHHEAHVALDRLLAAFPLAAVLSGVIVPYLHRLGERWAAGDVTVAQEHFASALLRGRLTGLGRDLGTAGGPRALLACAPGELHDLGLLCFALALADRGWQVTFLGADVPARTLLETAGVIGPRIVVVTAIERRWLEAIGAELGELADGRAVWVAGAGADAELAARLGVRYLEGDPVSGAAHVAA